jgi:branched-chain amino acid transport system permease protein
MQYVVDAINIGGLYALMALGIGLIFGIMRLINFAHGEFVMIGAYAMWLLIELPGILTVVFSITVVVLLALATERVAFRPLRDSAPATLLVASFTVSYFLQHLVVLLVGARPKPFSFAGELARSFEFLGLRLPIIQLISMALTIGALIGLVLLLTRTTIGIKLRAASQDLRAARLSGINVNRMLAAAFVASGLLAWVVSFVYAVQIGQLSPDMGIRPVVVGFVATILGGLGSLAGAAIGGFVIGAFSVLFDAVLPVELRVFREAFLFGFVLLVLLLRPQGLVSVAAERERV